MLNIDDAIDSGQLEQIRDHRETRQGQLQYLYHYKGTADHDDIWEHASRLSDNAIAREVMDRYWNDVYKDQQDQVVVTKKKQRRPRKEKVAKAAKVQQTVAMTAPGDDLAIEHITQDSSLGNDGQLHVTSSKNALMIARA
jgi:hypothetical protein